MKRKPGRPVEYRGERIYTGARLPKPLYRRLKMEAARRLISTNLIVVTALEKEVARLEKQKVPK